MAKHVDITTYQGAAAFLDEILQTVQANRSTHQHIQIALATLLNQCEKAENDKQKQITKSG